MNDPGPEDIRRQLCRDLCDLGLREVEDTADLLLQYLGLLEKWSRVHNLTSVRDVPSMGPAHLLDSLSALPFISGRRLLDVGSGAGLPGLPLAIANSRLSVTLLESRAKRTRFLNHVVGALSLGNVEVVCGRVEQYRPRRKFDTLVTRAFSSIAAFVDRAGHLCCKRGKIIALKGRYPEAELAELDQERFEVTEVCPVTVPGLHAARHVVVLTPL